jgi:hypothetical protein
MPTGGRQKPTCAWTALILSRAFGTDRDRPLIADSFSARDFRIG